MFSLFTRKPTAPRRVPEVDRLVGEAEAARAVGRLDEAVELYRAALDLAPLSRSLRAEFADVLLERAQARRPRRPGSSSAILPDMLDDAPAPRPKPAPRKLPERAREGMAWTDAAESHRAESREAVRHMMGELNRLSSRKPAARAAAAPARAVAPRPARGRVFLMAAFYGGLTLVLAGVVHGFIASKLQPAELPAVPQVAALPEGLAARLDEAARVLTGGDAERAVRVLEGLATEYPEHAEVADAALARALRALGNRQLDGQQYERAAETFERATRVDPLNPDNWIELARAQREHGRRLQARNATEGRSQLERARGAYERALELRPDHTAALVGAAQVHVFLNDRENAVRKYERVIGLAPGSAEATLARQHLRQLTGRS